jgi:hypothetical protein
MNRKTLPSTIGLLAMAMGILAALLPLSPVQLVAAEGPTVAIVGSLQSELGCAGDWEPACAATELVYDAADDVYQRTFDVPTGNWEYKAALNDSWDENYGANATRDGPTSCLNLARTRASSSTTTTRHTGSPIMSKIIATVPAASRASWAARATGSRTACAPGCRTRMATASTASRPPPSRLETMKAK